HKFKHIGSIVNTRTAILKHKRKRYPLELSFQKGIKKLVHIENPIRKETMLFKISIILASI
ncbi:hypothetical protein ACTHTN_20360, partial [Neisseria sp. P0015.S006]